MKTIEHHVIPCCLDGFDLNINIIYVDKLEHNLIHSTLGVPYWRIRRFRFTNTLYFKKDKNYYARLKIILSLYFKNINKLPIYLAKKHKTCIAEMIMFFNNRKHGFSVIGEYDINSLIQEYCNVLFRLSLEKDSI